MRFLIFIFSLFCVSAAAPKPLSEEELPFSTDNFPTFLDEANSKSAEEKDELALSYADQAETLKKRLKMKSMFNTNGPPAIGSDLFSNAAVEDNIKKVTYEGSGTGVDENSEKSEELETTSSFIDSFYSAQNATIEDSAVESSSNSSILYDQNTSDAEVDSITDTVYQKNEASAVLQASQTESDNMSDDEESDDEKTMTTVLNIGIYDGNETTSKSSCPPPQMCGKNCFVTLNDEGCQDCQCLWVAADCELDQDCPEKNQYCDLGKCNCQPGYQQNMRQSGVCEVDPEAKKKLGTTETETDETRELSLNEISKRIGQLKRNKRESKPRRSERLEWPGVCDKNEHCPENLVCIHGDCWSIPEKTKQSDYSSRVSSIISRNTDDEPKRVSFDTDEIKPPSTESALLKTTIPTTFPVPTTTTTTEDPRRGMARFVSEDFAKQLRRTTAKVKKYDWFPPTTTVSSPVTQLKTSTSHVPPLSVDHFVMIETTVSPFTPVQTTTRTIENDHKMEYMKERKPNFLGVKEDMTSLDYQLSSQSHIKKIHLDMPELLPRRTKHKKKLRTTTPFPDDASEVEEFSTVDEIEFPISSKIKKGAKKPRALSAEPTREELKDHKTLVDLFNSHAATALENEETGTIKPSFEILQSFAEPEPTPDIKVDLVTENPPPTFTTVRDLLSETISLPPEKKPYIIRKEKFSTIAPLSDISGDMASDDPPEVTPEPAPFEQHQMNVWYPMKKGDIPHLGIFSGEFRRSPRRKIKTADDFRLYNEYTKANRQNRPVRIEMDNASGLVRNECRENKNCGSKTVCCTKKWCDRTNNCGVGKFCLSDCNSTKLTFLPSSSHAESVIDIMYD